MTQTNLNNTSKKIGVVITGGTSLMIRDSNGNLMPPPDSAKRFHEVFDQVLNPIAQIEVNPVMNKDSSNMLPSDWQVISKAVYQFVCRSNIDGVVVLHGTDTMAYSSAATALALGANLNKPVIFTGAQANPDVSAGDSLINIVNSVQLASSDLAEVAIVFAHRIIRGGCGTKIDEKKYDAFRSINMPKLGWLTPEGIELSLLAKKRLPEREVININFNNHFSEQVLSIQLEPNNSANSNAFQALLEKKDDKLSNWPYYKVIILTALGAGNVPDSWLSFIEKATKLGIAVILTSPFPGHSTLQSRYLTGVKAISAGAIATGNLTHEMVKVKASWAVGCLLNSANPPSCGSEYLSEIANIMNNSYVGETGGSYKR